MSLKESIANINIKQALTTPRSKGIAAGMVLIVLLLVVLAIVTFALPRPATDAVKATQQPAAPAPAQPAPPAPAPAAATAPEDTETIVTDYDLLEYKDPFKPLEEATTTVAGAPGIGGSTSPGTGGTVSPGSPDGSGGSGQQTSLKLVEIIEQGGEMYAIMLYQGQEYIVKTGEQVANSPYKVTAIGDSSVTLLYGDDTITLKLGEEIVK